MSINISINLYNLVCVGGEGRKERRKKGKLNERELIAIFRVAINITHGRIRIIINTRKRLGQLARAPLINGVG